MKASPFVDKFENVPMYQNLKKNGIKMFTLSDSQGERFCRIYWSFYRFFKKH